MFNSNTTTGKPEGYGFKLHKNNHKTFAFFKNGLLEGKGKTINWNLETYIGEYKNDKRHGYGWCKTPDGHEYFG